MTDAYRQQIEAKIGNGRRSREAAERETMSAREREQDALDAAWVLLDGFAPEAAHTLKDHKVKPEKIKLGRFRTERGWRLHPHFWVSVNGRWRSLTTQSSHGRYVEKVAVGLEGSYSVDAAGTVLIRHRGGGYDSVPEDVPLEELLTSAIADLVINPVDRRRPPLRGQALADRWATIVFFVILAGFVATGTQAPNAVVGVIIFGVAGAVIAYVVALIVRLVILILDGLRKT